MTASVAFSIVIQSATVSTLFPGSGGHLVTGDGHIWSYGSDTIQVGTAVDRDGSYAGVYATELVLTNGQLYLNDSFNNWRVLQPDGTWVASSSPLDTNTPPPPPPPPPPPSLSLNWNPPLPGGATVDASTPLGTVVAKVQGVWSDSSPFVGSYRFTAPAYDGGSAAPSGVSAVNGSVNYALGAVVPASDTGAITSTGIYALVVCPDHSGALILNPRGPGISSAGGTTEDVDVEPF